jgi:hypothetical protein
MERLRDPERQRLPPLVARVCGAKPQAAAVGRWDKPDCEGAIVELNWGTRQAKLRFGPVGPRGSINMRPIGRWLLGGLTVVAVCVGCNSASTTNARSAHDKGVREATEAIAAGKLILKEYPPLPSPAQHGEYIQLLKERCGVDYQVPSLPPGVAEADFIQEVRGWNGTMEAEIRRKFGEGILGELRQEADKRWQEKTKSKK